MTDKILNIKRAGIGGHYSGVSTNELVDKLECLITEYGFIKNKENREKGIQYNYYGGVQGGIRLIFNTLENCYIKFIPFDGSNNSLNYKSFQVFIEMNNMRKGDLESLKKDIDVNF